MSLTRPPNVLAAVAVMLAAASSVSADPPDADEVLEKMHAQGETTRDLRVTFAVTKYDSIFEEKSHLRIEFWHKKPHLTKIDTFKKNKLGVSEHTQQVIIGEDFITRVWPKTRHGEKRKVDPKQMERWRQESNDPMTFFERTPEALKKDFDVTVTARPKPHLVTLTIRPKRPDVPFEYAAIELTVNTLTWQPESIRSIAKGEDPDWTLYEAKLFLRNIGLVDANFLPLPGVDVKEVEGEGDEAEDK
jgi:outer membrane lipoprotein-sorting protein